MDLTRTYKPGELTLDGIPTIETQFKDIDDNEEYIQSNCKFVNKTSDLFSRVKFLGLVKMNLDPFSNTKHLTYMQKKQLQKEMNFYSEIHPDKIVDEFNDICGEMLSDPKTDMNKLLVSRF